MIRKKQTNRGFTLIELMVVIVIIGVLASLAIPRFSEASAKAKVAEAPRVLATYESAFLAATPELTTAALDDLKGEELVFDAPKGSKWWTYGFGGDQNDGKAAKSASSYSAKAKSKMGKFDDAGILKTTYDAAGNGGQGCFTASVTTVTETVAKSMVPNFMDNAKCEIPSK